VSLPFFPAVRRLEQSADIAHAHMPYPPGEIAHLLAGRARRFVVSYHSDIVRQRVLGALYRPFLWQVLVQARLIAVGSPAYLQDSPFLRRHAAKCRVIPYGLDLGRLAATPAIAAEAAAWRARFDNRPLLLFVGRLRHYKGVNVLIEAMQQLPEVTALIVGIGPLAEELQQQAQAAGVRERVHFLGEQPDEAVTPLRYAADMFVLPSTNRAETFGIAQLESMACGRPTICTELGTGTSYVNQHGVTGLVIPPNDPSALAAAVRQLLANPDERQRMGEAARRRAYDLFSIDAMLDHMLDFYSEALQ
jgi:rhamnosyl/mannosyltransferase